MDDAKEPARRLSGVVRVPDEQKLRELLSRGGRLDFGCKPTVIPEAAGGFSVPVIGDAEVLEALQSDGFDLTLHELREPQEDVGKGDRFKGGAVAPHGFGEKVRETEPGGGAG